MSSKKPLSYFKERLNDGLDHLNLNRSFKRDMLLGTLYEQEKTASIEKLYADINSGSRKVVSINSIYRNIRLFTELGLVVRTKQGGNFEYAICHFEDADIELVCSKCGIQRIIEQKNDLKHEISRMLEEEGFYSNEQNIEIVSLCQDCALLSH